MADVFCEDEQPDWVQQDCGSELGGTIAVALIDPSVPDPTVEELQDESYWQGLISASPQKAWIIKDTRGAKGAGTPVEEDGYGLVPVQRVGDDHELPFEVQGIMRNRDFIAAMNKRNNWKFVYVTAGFSESDSSPAAEGYEAFFTKNVSMYGSILTEQSIRTRKRWSISAKWSTDLTPELPFLAPASLFAN